MNEADFDWDKHFGAASFASIRDLSPELNKRRFPSSFTPDRTQFYFSSQDDYGEVTDQEYLLSILKIVATDFHRTASNKWTEKHVLYTDFLAACSMLYELAGEDSPYGLPDELLAEMA